MMTSPEHSLVSNFIGFIFVLLANSSSVSIDYGLKLGPITFEELSVTFGIVATILFTAIIVVKVTKTD
jgi:hypothetical protein